MLGGGGIVGTLAGGVDEIRRVNMVINAPGGTNAWTVAGVVFEALFPGDAPSAEAHVFCGA
jgi:hypothetical protein